MVFYFFNISVLEGNSYSAAMIYFSLQLMFCFESVREGFQ